MRRLANEHSFRFSDESGVVTVNGHVFAGNGASDDQLQITGDYITVPSTYVPAEQLRQAVGGPASCLIAYEFLSDDITVVEASCPIEDGLPRLTIKINNPKRLFCSASGRVWDDVPSTSLFDPAGHEADTGVVVPFRKRNA